MFIEKPDIDACLNLVESFDTASKGVYPKKLAGETYVGETDAPDPSKLPAHIIYNRSEHVHWNFQDSSLPLRVTETNSQLNNTNYKINAVRSIFKLL